MRMTGAVTSAPMLGSALSTNTGVEQWRDHTIVHGIAGRSRHKMMMSQVSVIE
jgi:hypothetical protein